jgi:hypothetical protein
MYWSRRGGSSYPVDLSRLAGNTALERERFSTPVVNLDVLPHQASDYAAGRNLTLGQAVHDAYYAAVFDYHLSEVPALLRRNLLVLEAGGLVHFDLESLFETVLGQRFGLFHWVSPTGKQRTWAVLSTMGGFNLNLVPPTVLARCRDWLTHALGFVNFDPARPLDRTVETFCGLLQRAQDHRLKGRGDEAALHFVIALDFVFGTEGRSSDTVAERTAVIAHRPLTMSLRDGVRRVKQLYSARSKYVHEGRPIPAADINDAERVALEVLWTLLAVSGAGDLSSTSEWLTRIDYVLAAMKDGRSIPEAEFESIGIAPVTRSRVAPNHVTEERHNED